MSDSEPITIVITGPVGVGKTALITRFISDTFSEENDSTLDEPCITHCLINGKREIINFYDVDYVKSMEYKKFSYLSPKGVIGVFSETDSVSYNSMCQGIGALFEEIKKDYKNFPVIFMGNKSDDPLHKNIESFQGLDSNYSTIKSFEVSAKLNSNVHDAFSFAISQALGLNPSEVHIEIEKDHSANSDGNILSNDDSESKSKKHVSDVAELIIKQQNNLNAQVLNLIKSQNIITKEMAELMNKQQKEINQHFKYILAQNKEALDDEINK